MNRLGKFIRLDPERQIHFCLAVWYLLLARLWLAISTTDRVLGYLNHDDAAPAGVDETAAGGLKIDSFKWAIETAARAVPWRADCLIQAIAATRWLRRYRLRTSFFLGVAMSQAGAIRGHAWVDVDGDNVTGGVVNQNFKPLIEPGKPAIVAPINERLDGTSN